LDVFGGRKGLDEVHVFLGAAGKDLRRAKQKIIPLEGVGSLSA